MGVHHFACKDIVVSARNTLADRALQSGDDSCDERRSGLPAAPGNVGETVDSLAREAVGEVLLIGG
jgi:hypothetical protein